MAKRLVFPPSILEQHMVVLGKTGAGKSSALRHVVEYLLRQNKRVCVIDPKGDWNGLKVSADGKNVGFPVILFGDFKETAGKSIPADVPLNEFSGKHIAELVTSGNRPCVVGFRGWTQGNMHRFWLDFAATVFNSNEGEMYLVIDEVHNFCPKGKVLSPEVGMSIHWTNRIMNEGRGIGLVNLIASQRPQKVHNDTLTACETLIAMRVIHKADRDAVDDWIKGCGDEKQGKEVLNSLANMQRGEAYVWSPEAEFGPKRLTFPMFETFDSFAPPQLQKKVSGKDWSTVDLSEVKTKLATVIEKAKKNDPVELRRINEDLIKQIRKLETTKQQASRASEVPISSREEAQALKAAGRQIAGLKKALEAAMAVIVKISAVGFEGASPASIAKAMEAATKHITRVMEENTAAKNRELQKLKREAETIVERLKTILKDDSISVEISNEREFATRVLPTAKPREPRRDKVDNGDGTLNAVQRATLTALAQHQDGLSKAQILLHTGYSASGSVSKAFAALVRNGWMQALGGGLQSITREGLDALGEYEPLPTGSALREQLLAGSKLSTVEKSIVRVVSEQYPDPISKGEILKRANYAASGSASKAFARLSRYGYIVKTGQGLKASDVLFD